MTTTSKQVLYRSGEMDTPAPDRRRELSVVIPAFNEQESILETIVEIQDSLSKLRIDFEIVVVDDGSTDGTRQAADTLGARVLSNPENCGYGASLKRGISESKSEYVAIIDADGTYPAGELPSMLELARTADMVVGARSPKMTNVPLVRRPAKFILSRFANFLAGRKIPDLNSGLRVLRRSSLEAFIPLLPSGFSFTTTITLCMICSGLTVHYTPIDYRRRVGKSTIRPADFFNFMLLVVRAIVLFNPLRVFLPLGAFLFGLGMIKLVYDVVIGNLSESAVLGLLAGIIICSFGLLADMVSRLHLHK